MIDDWIGVRVPDFQTHLPQALEGVVSAEFRLPVGREEAHLPLVGRSASLFPSLNYWGLIGYIG